MISKTWNKLRDPEYRKAFVASQINIGVPFQIRALLKSRPGWTQQTLAERASMLQPRISGLMAPGRVRPNIETLRRIAEAFDCGLVVRFAPFSEMVRWSENFDPENFSVPSFNDDSINIGDASGVSGEQASSIPVASANQAQCSNLVDFPIYGTISRSTALWSGGETIDKTQASRATPTSAQRAGRLGTGSTALLAQAQ
jgi:transcriptional regulator with XRE-family HTH domain